MIEDLQTLDQELALLEEEAQLLEARVSTKGVNLSLMTEQNRFRTQLNSALDDFNAGTITANQLGDRWSQAVLESYPRAYQIGASTWGAGLDSGDLLWLRGAVEEEQRFIRAFASQVGSGHRVMPINQRLEMYVQGLDGARLNGFVEKAPKETIIWWRLGDAEHCPGCLVLAGESPWRKEDLPTVPRAGATPCRGRCSCFLEVEQKPRPPRRPAPRVTAVGDFSAATSQTGQPVSNTQLLTINNLRARMNFHRRRVAAAKTKTARDAAIIARRDANRELVDYLDRNRIREVPLLSTQEVITGADVSPAVVGELLLGGVDGATLKAMSSDEWRVTILALRAEITELLDDV